MKNLSKSVQEAIAGFITLTTVKGWSTKLAFECSYDGVYDEISEEDFLNAIQLTGNTIA